MARLSVDNGNTFVDVGNLSTEQVAEVISSGALDHEISLACQGETDREWLDDYARLHEIHHKSSFILG